MVDRENEIRAFVSQEYWSIDAKFTAPPSRKVFAAKLVKVDGERVDKTEIPDKAAADALLERLQNASYSVQNVKKRVTKRHPAPPFITSTLQQDASYRLGFQSKRTMKVAQELYEGVDIDGLGDYLYAYRQPAYLRRGAAGSRRLCDRKIRRRLSAAGAESI